MSEITESKKITFLHCSDIHLDSPFSGLPAEKSEERRRALRSSFRRMIDYVRDRGINYVLISGDLFTSGFVTNTTVETLIREFRSCPDAKFIIAPGLNDRYEDNPVYMSGRLPENCYIFTDPTLSRFDFEEDRLTVYGWAFVDGAITESPLADKVVDDSSKTNIVVGYCDVDGSVDSISCPIPSTDLKRFGADYYALGSHHGATDFKRDGGTIYSYSGSIECMGFDEPELGGAKVLAVQDNNGELSVDCKSVSFGRMRFVTETVDVTAVNNNSEIINRISALINSKKYSSEIAMRLVLTGDVDPRFILPKNLDSEAFGLYYFEMVDKTLPLYGTEHFMRDMSVAGEIYRRLLPMLKSENEEDRLVAAKAFRVGLASLEKRDIEI